MGDSFRPYPFSIPMPQPARRPEPGRLPIPLDTLPVARVAPLNEADMPIHEPPEEIKTFNTPPGFWTPRAGAPIVAPGPSAVPPPIPSAAATPTTPPSAAPPAGKLKVYLKEDLYRELEKRATSGDQEAKALARLVQEENPGATRLTPEMLAQTIRKHGINGYGTTSTIAGLEDRTPGSTVKSPPLPADTLYRLARETGFPTDAATIMTAIAMAESYGGRPGALNMEGDDNSYGIWQINMKGDAGPERRAKFGLSRNEDLFDPATNAKAAFQLWSEKGGQFTDWGAYTDRNFEKFLPAARAAMQRYESGEPEEAAAPDAPSLPSPESAIATTAPPPTKGLRATVGALGQPKPEDTGAWAWMNRSVLDGPPSDQFGGPITGVKVLPKLLGKAGRGAAEALPGAYGTSAQFGAGLAAGISEAGIELATPLNIGLATIPVVREVFGLTRGGKALAKLATKLPTVGKLLSGAYRAGLGAGGGMLLAEALANEAPEVYEAWKRGDSFEVGRQGAKAIIDAAFGVQMGKHALRGGKKAAAAPVAAEASAASPSSTATPPITGKRAGWQEIATPAPRPAAAPLPPETAVNEVIPSLNTNVLLGRKRAAQERQVQRNRDLAETEATGTPEEIKSARAAKAPERAKDLEEIQAIDRELKTRGHDLMELRSASVGPEPPPPPLPPPPTPPTPLESMVPQLDTGALVARRAARSAEIQKADEKLRELGRTATPEKYKEGVAEATAIKEKNNAEIAEINRELQTRGYEDVPTPAAETRTPQELLGVYPLSAVREPTPLPTRKTKPAVPIKAEGEPPPLPAAMMPEVEGALGGYFRAQQAGRVPPRPPGGEAPPPAATPPPPIAPAPVSPAPAAPAIETLTGDLTGGYGTPPAVKPRSRKKTAVAETKAEARLIEKTHGVAPAEAKAIAKADTATLDREIAKAEAEINQVAAAPFSKETFTKIEKSVRKREAASSAKKRREVMSGEGLTAPPPTTKPPGVAGPAPERAAAVRPQPPEASPTTTPPLTERAGPIQPADGLSPGETYTVLKSNPYGLPAGEKVLFRGETNGRLQFNEMSESGQLGPLSIISASKGEVVPFLGSPAKASAPPATPKAQGKQSTPTAQAPPATPPPPVVSTPKAGPRPKPERKSFREKLEEAIGEEPTPAVTPAPKRGDVPPAAVDALFAGIPQGSPLYGRAIDILATLRTRAPSLGFQSALKAEINTAKSRAKDELNPAVRDILEQKIRLMQRMVGTAAPPTRPIGVKKKTVAEAPATIEKAVTPGGKLKIGVETEALAEVLGSSLYGKSPSAVVPKELTQNAFDAIRGVPNGKVEVDVYGTDVIVSDNGPGMTRQMLETVFTDLGASGKRNVAEASGGFGLAKAAPLMMSKKLTVKTVAREADGKLMEHSFSGSPQQLLKEGVDIQSREAPAGTQTGTIVRSEIEPFDTYEAEWAARNYARSIRPPGELVIRKRGGKLDLDEAWTPDRLEPISLKIPEVAEVDLYQSKTTKDTDSLWAVEVEVNNNGIFQFVQSVYGSNKGASGIPRRIAVDIKSLVQEGHRNYPFTANREQLRDVITSNINHLVKEEILEPAYRRFSDAIGEVYRNIPVLGRTEKEFYFHDSGGRFTDEEIAALRDNPAVINLANSMREVADEALTAIGEGSFTYLYPIADRVDKLGFVFNDALHGVNLSKPGSETMRGVFVNPFSFATKGPIESASRMWHTLKHELLHNIVGGHNASFTTAEGDLTHDLAKIEIDAIQKLRAAYGKNRREFKDGITEAVRIYNDSRLRPGRIPDPLRGEESVGGKPEHRGSGKGSGAAASGLGGRTTVPKENAAGSHGFTLKKRRTADISYGRGAPPAPGPAERNISREFFGL